MQTIDQVAVNTLRFLSIDEVEKAKSGHPGFPLGTAPLMYTVWDRFMNYNPKDPNWFNRDRFILSPGHGSALYYAMLHLAGYDVSIEQLKNFRQWGSITPGHPEYGVTPGVDASTGPLGHGFAMGVGFAIAETMLAAKYNKPGFEVVNHYTYGLTSDGDQMEGVASEAASLAGTLGLGKLIYLYDDNHITIEGDTEIAFREDVGKRFEAYGWQVLRVADSEDIDALENAIKEAKADTEHPSLIIVRTHIGYGSPKQDNASCHGEPLGAEGVAKTKEAADWPVGQSFYVPVTVRKHFDDKLAACAEKQAAWEALLADYKVVYPELGKELEERIKGDVLVSRSDLEAVFNDIEGISIREAGGEVLQKLSMQLPQLVGGSADLGPSNKTVMKTCGYYSKDDRTGRNIHFGVREHAMGKALNGIALHGGFIPFGGTFLVFADFMRPAVRMAALMGLRSIFVFTHDSIAVGEDGPTHQPVEHAMSLRVIPNLCVIRPADALETAMAWQTACLNQHKPTALLLSRQKLPVLHKYTAVIHDNAGKGAYVLDAGKGEAKAVIIATGSEVHLALEAQAKLAEEGICVSVVSMPSWDMFEMQSEEYKKSVLPEGLSKVAVEAGVTLGWSRYTGSEDNVIGINKFGASAPGGTVMKEYGFTAENVAAKVKSLL
ncbi:transketolase [Phascolarctobacterium sp. ET69]|uniref:transketolase n=1 Tax=Phascolarctobacterium sp. ET69 TaxID=2939420 RepID=UPI002011682C|nr:transketolase [Phascolarctobacterium sp. ET69]MCL1604800.1 transketolase [Phascolarctobacterium sp. ET69]